MTAGQSQDVVPSAVGQAFGEKPADARGRLRHGYNNTHANAQVSLVSPVASQGVRRGSDESPTASPQAGAGGRVAKAKPRPSSLADARTEGRRHIAEHAARTRRTASTALELDAALGLIEAADEASRIGLPLNRFVTINWEKGGASDGSHATSVFLRKVGDWCRRHGWATAFIWVRETGRWNGQHAHVLIHIPPALAKHFARRQRDWLAQCGLGWGKGMVKGKPVGTSRSRSVGLDGAMATYRTGLMNVVDYLLKETEPAVREQLGIASSAKRTGLPVTFKRAGVSANIDRKAREKSGRTCRAAIVADLGKLSGW